jgi:chromosome segregation ATPase
MLSGRQTLASLDDGMRQLHDSVQDMDQQVRESSNSLMDLQRKQSENFKRMAQIRLDEVVSDELRDGLSLADRQARELIRKRAAKLGAVNRQIKTTREKLAGLEEQRGGASQDCDRAAEALDRAEAKTQQRLAANPAYQQQLEKARQAERTAEHAMEKTRQAQSTREQKGGLYESDPLFSYLWQRGYGTPSYTAGNLTRYLDDWVAGLCDYSSARPDYSALLEIPVRLKEHADRLHAQADEEFIQLTRLEVEEAAADGVPERKTAVEETRARLGALDQEIEAAEDGLEVLEQQRGRFANGEDEDFQQAVQTVSGAFERESLLNLYEYARATATPEDDLLVRELEDLRERLEQAGETLADRKRMRERHADRLHELEDIRRRFKRSRFDSTHSEFRNDALLTMAVSQFLAGTVTSRELWRTIERGQRYRKIRANPNFGSGDFLPRPGTWNQPFPRRRGGFGGGFGGGRRRSGPRSSGGFRTGGGF